jgi:hypothetical protein
MEVEKQVAGRFLYSLAAAVNWSSKSGYASSTEEVGMN